MKAALCSTIDRISVSDVARPSIGAGELLLRVESCGLCGSDIKKLEGAGLASAKVLGHEVVGFVEAVGAGVERFRLGDRVVAAHHVPCFDCTYCRHGNYSMCATFKASNLDPGGFAEYVRVPAPHVKHATFALPESLSTDKALFTEPLACCVRCIRRLPILAGDSVLLVGFGSIGLLLEALLRRKKARVLAMDLDEKRLALAHQMGARAIHPERDLVKRIVQDETQGRGVDLVLFTAGPQALLQQSLTWCRNGGTICLFAELTGADGILSAKELYHREITVTSSYSPGPEDLAEAFRLIASGEVTLEGQEVTHYALEHLSQAIRATLDRKIIKAAILPRKEAP